jgi:rhamnosyl/mannosyltransferase
MFGMVQLEAMAHGLPVIATDIPGSGTPEFTLRSGGGIVVPPGDKSALASAIARLVRDEHLYARLSAAGIATVADRAGHMNSLRRLVEVCTGKRPA